MSLPWTNVVWKDVTCDECGAPMKAALIDVTQECNQCKLLAQLARFEYLLEQNLGWS